MFENLTYTYSPDEDVPCYHTGGATEHCPNDLVSRYYAGTRPVKRGYVGSYRGKREKLVAHAFDRFRYHAHGHCKLHHCNLNMDGGLGPYIDGGYNWIYLLSKHGLVSPLLDFSPEAFSLTEEDEQYRKYIIQKTFAKANSPRFAVATQLAELGETIGYINDILGTLAKLFYRGGNVLSKRADQKLTLSGLKDLWKRVTNPESTWLEYRYAIMPMILSVQDLLEAIITKGASAKVDGYKKYPKKSLDTHWFNYGAGNLCFTVEKNQAVKTGVGMEILNQHDQSPWGTGAYDLVLAAWEKVTLSFVLDWILDMGQWLESFRNTDLVLGQRFSTLVKETEWKLWLDVGRSNTGNVYSCPTKTDPFIVSALHITRIIGEDVHPPALPMLTPGKLSVFRQLDALALITGFFRGLRR